MLPCFQLPEAPSHYARHLTVVVPPLDVLYDVVGFLGLVPSDAHLRPCLPVLTGERRRGHTGPWRPTALSWHNEAGQQPFRRNGIAFVSDAQGMH